MASVAIRDVRKAFGAVQVIHGVDITIDDCQFVVLVGPSGCGKSTLLRILNRIYQLYPGQRATGEVLVDGENILAPGLDLNLLRA